MTEVFKAFVQVDEMNNKNEFDLKRAFVKFLSVLGIWIILFSIFTNGIDLQASIVIAIILSISAGLFGQFLGVTNTGSVPRDRNVSNLQRTISTDYYEEEMYLQSLNKIQCTNCGSLVTKNDIFCGECGEKLSYNV